MALSKYDILNSQNWFVDYMKASIFTHDEKMSDLTFNSDDNELVDNFIFRVKTIYSNYLCLEEIVSQTEKSFIDNILEHPFEDLLADYTVTPIKINKAKNKLIKWIKTPVKGNWSKQHTLKPSPIKLARLFAKMEVELNNIYGHGLIEEGNYKLEWLNEQYAKLKNAQSLNMSYIELSKMIDSTVNIDGLLKYEFSNDLNMLTNKPESFEDLGEDDIADEGSTDEDTNTKSGANDLVGKLRKVLLRKYKNYDLFFNPSKLNLPFFKDGEFLTKDFLFNSEVKDKKQLASCIKKLRAEYDDNKKVLIKTLSSEVNTLPLFYKSEDSVMSPSDLTVTVLNDIEEKIWNGTWGWHNDQIVPLKQHVSIVATRKWMEFRKNEDIIVISGDDNLKPQEEEVTVSSSEPYSFDSAKMVDYRMLLLELYLEEKNRAAVNADTPRYILAAHLDILDSGNYDESFLGWFTNEEELSLYLTLNPDEKKALRMLIYLRVFCPDLTEVNRRRWISEGKKIIGNVMKKRGLLRE